MAGDGAQQRRHFGDSVVDLHSLDGAGSNMVHLEVRQRALQLDELCLAKGSPTSAAVENHQRATVTSRLVETHQIAVLVR